MSSTALSSAQFPEIHASDLSSGDARRSRGVSSEEFQSLAAEGQQHYDRLSVNASPARGLERGWGATTMQTYAKTRDPWGGATIDSHTGHFLKSDADKYAITVREPGQEQISVPAHASYPEFKGAMTQAKEKFGTVLARENHHLGVFHDADKGTIDFDPVTTVNTHHEVETLGAYTHATGGAYHFKSGDGYWPPHVKDAE